MKFISRDGKQYALKNARSCSREINLAHNSMPRAFGLPDMQANPVKMGSFVGDVEQGGSCNVSRISFTPHNLTHVETPRHVVTHGLSLKDLPVDLFHGVAYIIDLSELDLDDGYIYPRHLEAIENIGHITILGIKTKISNMPPDTDFSGTDPICLHPSSTEYLHQKFPHIKFLLLDLPSADKEDDGGKLLAHRNFFGIPNTTQGEPKAILELAYFHEIKQSGLYYVYCTPPRVDLDAFLTDLVLLDLIPI